MTERKCQPKNCPCEWVSWCHPMVTPKGVYNTKEGKENIKKTKSLDESKE
jgi:hypothetical protein